MSQAKSHLVVMRKSDVAMERIATLDTLERARIALAHYRTLMSLHAPDRGLVNESYPYGIDVENEIRDLLNEPAIDAWTAAERGQS